MTQFAAQLPELYDELLIARINDGRLPVETGAMLMPQRGEQVHAEVRPRLAKEVTRRGERGVSWRILRRQLPAGWRHPVSRGAEPRANGHAEYGDRRR